MASVAIRGELNELPHDELESIRLGAAHIPRLGANPLHF
jgi:hypothetical protein